jgi:hypothetical protein
MLIINKLKGDFNFHLPFNKLLAGFRILTVLVSCFVRPCSRLVFLAAAPKGLVRQLVGLLQTVVAVALFFLASLNSFSGSGWLAVSPPAGLVFNKSSLPLLRFASAASRASPV